MSQEEAEAAAAAAAAKAAVVETPCQAKERLEQEALAAEEYRYRQELVAKQRQAYQEKHRKPAEDKNRAEFLHKMKWRAVQQELGRSTMWEEQAMEPWEETAACQGVDVHVFGLSDHPEAMIQLRALVERLHTESTANGGSDQRIDGVALGVDRDHFLGVEYLSSALESMPVPSLQRMLETSRRWNAVAGAMPAQVRKNTIQTVCELSHERKTNTGQRIDYKHNWFSTIFFVGGSADDELRPELRKSFSEGSFPLWGATASRGGAVPPLPERHRPYFREVRCVYAC